MKQLGKGIGLLWMVASCTLLKPSVKSVHEERVIDTVPTMVETKFESTNNIADTCRQHLYAYVKKYWSYDDSISHYYSLQNGKGAWYISERFQHCLLGMDTMECFKLLGRPHQKIYSGYLYYVNGNCFDFELRSNQECNFFNLIIDNKGKVKLLTDGGMSREE